MNLREAQLRLMLPAIPFMCAVERMFLDLEDGCTTEEHVLPWVRIANAKIESLIGPDNLRLIELPDVKADDRFRTKYFVDGHMEVAHVL